MRRRLLLATAFALAFAASAAGDDAAPGVLSLTQSAKTKLDLGDAKGAAEDLSKAVDLAPKSASLRYERAICRSRLGDVRGTVEDVKKAAALAPGEYPLDIALWRAAVETSRLAGGSKDPDLELIQAEVAAIRMKQFKAPVTSATQSPKEFGAMVDASIEKEAPKARREDMQAGLHRLGLLPGDFDMKREVTGALMSQAAAYYDPKQKKFFNLVSDAPAMLIEATAAHELVHALQDQYHDLDKWFAGHEEPKTTGARDDDRVLALRCVVEGEATFVQTVWQVQGMMKTDASSAVTVARFAMPVAANMEIDEIVKLARANAALLPPGSEMTKAIEEMSKIQPYVMAPLLGAYMSGANLCQTVQAAGGWEALDKLYEEPPESTEQCLHPEKYAKLRDRPTPLALPDIADVAGAAPSGWRRADLAVHGELYLRVLLLRHGTASAVARKAAAGWDGDVYGAWRSSDGRTAIVLATTWDTPRDAQEFFDAYRRTLPRKYEKLAEETGSDLSSLRYTYGEEKLGTGALVLRDREVFAVEGFEAELRTKFVDAVVAAAIAHVE
jgi:hypothetical protein